MSVKAYKLGKTIWFRNEDLIADTRWEERVYTTNGLINTGFLIALTEKDLITMGATPIEPEAEGIRELGNMHSSFDFINKINELVRAVNSHTKQLETVFKNIEEESKLISESTDQLTEAKDKLVGIVKQLKKLGGE